MNSYNNTFENSYNDVESARGFTRTAQIYDNKVHPFPNRRLNSHAKGWEFNISERFVFTQVGNWQLQLKPTQSLTQFDLLCKLLKAGTCKTVFIDCVFDSEQTTLVRLLQRVSGTNIVNARFSHAFAQQDLLQA